MVFIVIKTATAYTYGTERIASYTGSSKMQYVYDGKGSVAQEIGNGILSKSVERPAKNGASFNERT